MRQSLIRAGAPSRLSKTPLAPTIKKESKPEHISPAQRLANYHASLPAEMAKDEAGRAKFLAKNFQPSQHMPVIGTANPTTNRRIMQRHEVSKPVVNAEIAVRGESTPPVIEPVMTVEDNHAARVKQIREANAAKAATLTSPDYLAKVAASEAFAQRSAKRAISSLRAKK